MRRWSGRLLALWLCVAGLAFVVTGLATIATYAWPQPTQDQYRLYRSYLEHPFPRSVLLGENQHRPIVPGLVRVAEIHLRDADQRLQIGFGASCAALAALLMALFALPQPGLGLPARVAGGAAGAMAIFWFGNARMLLHGNELVHAYLVVLAVIAVGYAAWRARQADARRWTALGTLAATVATFCFGPGIALFPTLALLAALQRLPWRTVAMPVLACLACLLLYVFVLPGDERVRAVLAFRPLDIADVATRWLAAPWVNGWLGFADPPLTPVHALLMSQAWPAWVDSANALQAVTGLTWMHGLALAFGGAGLLVLASALLHALRTREGLSRLQALALATMLFGAACGVIIGIGRLDYLVERPDQVFADRYLPWSCLFWFGVAAWGLASARRPVRGTVMALIAALPVALWPTHELGAGWGATVYRQVQATAAAARSEVIDPDVFWRDDPSVLFEDKLRSLHHFRERGLAMFAPPGARLLGQRWNGVVETRAGFAARLMPPTPAHDVRGTPPAVRFEGVLEGIEGPDAGWVLAVLDPEDRVVGYGEPSFDARPDAKRLRWWPTAMQGFVGFVRDYDATRAYRVVALDAANGVALSLGTLPTD